MRARARRPGQTSIETLRPGAGAATDLGARSIEGDDGALACVVTPPPYSPVIAEISALHRLRMKWLKAELGNVLRAQAHCRDYTAGDKEAAGKLYRDVEAGKEVPQDVRIALTPYLAAIAPYRAEGAVFDKRLAKLARELPVYPWVKSVWGFSDAALAKIVGEAGDLGEWRTVSGLWKRFGLAPYQGKAITKGRQGLSAEEWEAAGYSPKRRSALWNIGNGLIGGMGRGVRPAVGEDWQAREDWSPYQKLYVGRLIHEAERDPEKMARPDTAAGKMSFSLHAHNRAKRYVEKRALRDLYSAWRAAERGHAICAVQASCAPPAPFPMAAE